MLPGPSQWLCLLTDFTPPVWASLTIWLWHTYKTRSLQQIHSSLLYIFSNAFELKCYSIEDSKQYTVVTSTLTNKNQQSSNKLGIKIWVVWLYSRLSQRKMFQNINIFLAEVYVKHKHIRTSCLQWYSYKALGLQWCVFF